MSSSSRHTIQRSLLSKNLIFTILVLIFGTTLVFMLSLLLLSQLYITRLAAISVSTSNEITQFLTERENELARFESDEAMVGRDKTMTARALGRVYRTTKLFQRVLLVDDQEAIIYAYPPEESRTTLSAEEETAISLTLDLGRKQRVISQIDGNGQMVSFIIPVIQTDAQIQSILIGRVPIADLADILAVEDEETISGYLVNSENGIMLQTGGATPMTVWPQEDLDAARDLPVPQNMRGEAFLGSVSSQLWDLVYTEPPSTQPWTVSLVMPFQPVLNQAMSIAFSFAAVVLIIGTVYYTSLRQYSRGLSKPIKQLAKESRSIAEGGSLTNRIYTNRRDEVGDLAQAFTNMQLALKGRLDELSLLLDVTQDISSSINIKQSMPIILQGALRGTGASGARVLIKDPTGRAPFIFSEGPAGPDLALFDRSLMTLLREHKELALGTVQEISSRTGLAQGSHSPIRALYALPLQINNVFQGVIFLGYWQTRDFTLSERQLLRTLASQAAVLVENAYLFATAEGGRRRLAAVLASTSEAIIVTDQTHRIVDINRAMESAFQLSLSQVKGRSLADVINSEPLVEALKKSKTGRLDFEIEGANGRSYIVNISPIVTQAGLMMGKVAILTDVTYYKEIDRLKSEFVENVSHDLRRPLILMHGYISTLSMTEGLTSEQRNYIDNITHSVNHMTSMVETLLDLARLEAGVDLIFEKFDVMDLLHELAEKHLIYARDAGNVLRVKENKNLPPVIADKSFIMQAIENFMNNGYKYAPNSGEMLLAAEQVGDEVVISVRDKGPGIARQDQLRLFEKFYRVEHYGSQKVEGTGLGLGLVKSIAERHGGHAWVRSEVGLGSTFYISIPLQGISVSNSKS